MNLITESKKLITEAKKKLKQYVNSKKAEDRQYLLFKPEYYPTIMSEQAKWRVNIFRETTFLSNAQKDIVLPKIRSLAVKLARLILIEARISYYSQILLGIIAMPFFLGISIFSSISISINPWNSWGGGPHNLPENFDVISLIVYWVYIFTSNFMERKSTDQAKSKHTFAELLLSFGGLAILVSLSKWISISLFSFVLYTLFFGIFVRCLFHYISSAIKVLITLAMNLFGYDKLPESIVVHNILRILDEIERHPKLLSDLEYKKMVISRLEYIADAVGRNTPDLLKTKNSEFNSSIKVTCQNIANSVRDKKLWVLTPKEDTAQYLANYLANFLFHFAKGDWDTLERSEAPELTLSERWSKRYLPILRPVLLLGLPMVAYFWLQNSKFSSEPWMGAVTGYLIMWLVINFVSLLDPSAKEKIGALADTAGMF